MITNYSQYRALLMDVDQTLTRSDRSISVATIGALHALTEKKISTSVCTGRTWASLDQHHILRYFPQDSLHITNAGTQIVTAAGSVLWQVSIDPATLDQLLGYTKQESLNFRAKDERTMYCTESAFKEYERFNAEYPGFCAPLTADLPAISACTIKHFTAEQESAIRQIPGLHVITLESYGKTPTLEITPQGVTKATGVHKWSEMTGIAPQDCIGVGDSANDFEFLQVVGLKVAMGNATSELKAVADQVIGSTDDDGLALFIEEIVAAL